MDAFIGRKAELALLRKRLDRVADTGSGVAIAIRGRRQVGKSRLVQEFCDIAGVPYLYITATKGVAPSEAVSSFLAELRSSGLAGEPDLVPTGTGGWADAFRALAAALPDRPAIVVLDEVPWFAEQDETFDGVLQTAWDRLLPRHPVLLLLLGSDLHMMERLTAYDRPFYGRADNFVLHSLNVAETGHALGLDATEAIDAHLVSAGLPGILRSWPHGMPPQRFLEQECADPAAPVFGVPESTLLAEFPRPDQARRVLEAVGSGNRTHATIAAAVGGRAGVMPSGSLSPLLTQLSDDKRILVVDRPLSTRPGKPGLYRIADTNLQLYLAMLRPAQELVRRGRAEAAYQLILRRWASWRGRAVEPLIRESLEIAAGSGALAWPEAEVVGGWWNRRFDPEVDLVGADRGPVAGRVCFAGSTKWLASPFDRHDLVELTRAAAQVPGFSSGDAGLVVVSLSGTDPAANLDAIDLTWGPSDIVATWDAGS